MNAPRRWMHNPLRMHRGDGYAPHLHEPAPGCGAEEVDPDGPDRRHDQGRHLEDLQGGGDHKGGGSLGKICKEGHTLRVSCKEMRQEGKPTTPTIGGNHQTPNVSRKLRLSRSETCRPESMNASPVIARRTYGHGEAGGSAERWGGGNEEAFIMEDIVWIHSYITHYVESFDIGQALDESLN